MSLYPLLSSTFCPLSLSNSKRTFCWFCVIVSTAAYYNLSNVCQYLTMYRVLVLCKCVHLCFLYSVNYLLYLTQYRLLVLCHRVHCTLVESVHYLSLPHTATSVGSVSPCPLLSSTVCPQSVSTSQFTVCWFCVTMSTAVFFSLSTVCQYLTIYRLLVLCHYVHCCLLQSVQSLSVPHNLTSVGFVLLCPLLSSTVCP